MTREEWFAAIDPRVMLEEVQGEPPRYPQSPVVARRLRLFACAAARRVWDLLSNDARSAIQASERFAQGRASLTDLVATALAPTDLLVSARQLALAAAQAASTGLPLNRYAQLLQRNYTDGYLFAPHAARFAARAVATHKIGVAPLGQPTPRWHSAWTAAFASVRATQADDFRDIFPPPSYQPRRDPSWISSTVMALARQMDESGDFGLVPILGDALEDAGCEDDAILNCCRRAGSRHVRGNWVVELILDRA